MPKVSQKTEVFQAGINDFTYLVVGSESFKIKIGNLFTNAILVNPQFQGDLTLLKTNLGVDSKAPLQDPQFPGNVTIHGTLKVAANMLVSGITETTGRIRSVYNPNKPNENSEPITTIDTFTTGTISLASDGYSSSSSFTLSQNQVQINSPSIDVYPGPGGTNFHNKTRTYGDFKAQNSFEGQSCKVSLEVPNEITIETITMTNESSILLANSVSLTSTENIMLYAGLITQINSGTINLRPGVGGLTVVGNSVFSGNVLFSESITDGSNITSNKIETTAGTILLKTENPGYGFGEIKVYGKGLDIKTDQKLTLDADKATYLGSLETITINSPVTIISGAALSLSADNIEVNASGSFLVNSVTNFFNQVDMLILDTGAQGLFDCHFQAGAGYTSITTQNATEGQTNQFYIGDPGIILSAIKTVAITCKEVRIVTGVPPATAASFGVTGDIRFDANYMYRCVADNTWKRTPLSTW